MDLLGWLIRLAVAIAFAVAALAKLLDQAGLEQSGFERTLRLVPVAPPVRRGLLVGVPVAEALVVVLLLQPWIALGVLSALLVLGSFTAFLVGTPQLDAAGGCRCFGALPSNRATTRAHGIARNLALAGALLAVAALQGPGLLLVAVLVAVLGYVLYLPLLAAARPLAAAAGTMVVFVEDGCSGCHELLARMPGWSGGPAVILVDDPAVLDAEGISATPSAVVLAADGRRVDANGRPSPVPVVGPAAIEERYRQAARGHDLPIDPDAEQTLLVFLRRDDVLDLTDDLSDHATDTASTSVVVLSAQRLRHPPDGVVVRHDPDGRTAALFGVTRTPSAVLVARDGSRLSPVLSTRAQLATLLQPPPPYGRTSVARRGAAVEVRRYA